MHGGYVAEIEHLEQLDLKEYIREKEDCTLVCLDEVTDPRNIGSLIRSASSFKIDINKDIESLNISNSAAIVFHYLSYLKKKS